METAISINKYIYNILNKDPELKDMVGNNIYPLVAEDSATFPFIIFKKNNVVTEYAKICRVFDLVSFSVVVVSNQYFDSVTIAERVRSLLELNNDSHLLDTRLSGITEDYIDDSYVLQLDFTTIIK